MNFYAKISELKTAQMKAFESYKNGSESLRYDLKVLCYTNNQIYEEYRQLFNTEKVTRRPPNVEDLNAVFKFAIERTDFFINRLERHAREELEKFRNEVKAHIIQVELQPEPAKYEEEPEPQPEREDRGHKWAYVRPTEMSPVNAGELEFDQIPHIFTKEAKYEHGVYAVEEPDQTRKFFDSFPRPVMTWLDSINGCTKAVHEVIDGPCRFFADIDDKENKYTREGFLEMLESIKNNFCWQFTDYYNVDTFLYINFYFAISESPLYNSAHIYIDIFNSAHNMYYASPKNQGPFWAKFSKFLAITEFVDLTVYRNRTQIRLPLTRKNGYLLRPMKAIVNKPIGRGAYREEYDQAYETFFESGVLTQNLVSSKIREHPDTRDVITEEAPLEKYCAMATFMNYGDIELEAEKQPIEPRFYTEYEKLMFERILNNSSLEASDMVSKKSMASAMMRSICYRIHCFYFTQPISVRIDVAHKFLKARGINELRLVMTLFEGWNECYHAYGLDSMKKFFKYEPCKVIEANMRYIEYPDWQGTLLLKSGTGTGKTYGFLKKVKDSTALFISCRISLSDEFKRSANEVGINMTHYSEALAEKIIEQKPNHFCVQLNSLWKFIDIMDHYEYIFIDESEAILACFDHVLQTNPIALLALRSMFADFLKNKKTVLCSANLGDRTKMFVEDFGVSYLYVENTRLDKEGYTAKLCDSGAFFNNLKNFAEAGEKIVVATCTKKDAIRISEFVGETGAKVLLQTADTKKVAVEEWQEYDCVVYTSTIEEGVSINYEYFDRIMGYFGPNVLTYDACFQMLFRVRRPKNKELFVYAGGSSALQMPDRFDIKRATQSVVMTGQDHNKMVTRAEKIDTFNSYVYKHMTDPLDKTLVRNALFRNYSNTYFAILLKRELELAGVRVERLKEKLATQLPDKGQVNAIYNEHIMQNTSITAKMNYLGLNNVISVEGHSVEDSMEMLVAIKNINVDAKLTHKQYACKLLAGLLEEKKGWEEKDLSPALNGFFDKHYGAISACFGKRKYSLEHLKKMKMQYKVQFIAGILRVAGAELVKSETGLYLYGHFSELAEPIVEAQLKPIFTE